MRIRTRILFSSGILRFGGTAVLLGSSVLFHPVFAFFALAWLAASRRIIRQWLLPSLFPYVTCHSARCRRRIPLRQRWRCLSDQWTDGKIRHALAVYSDQGHEVRSFDCPYCDTTISLQKGDRQLYKRWKPVAVSGSVGNAPRPAHGLQIGFDRTYSPTALVRWWRWLLGRPAKELVVLSNDVLSRHGTIFGATGMGKSTLIINLAQQLFRSGDGATFLDPAGDLSRDLLRHVPASRVDDVIYIDVADQQFPFPFNILHAQDDNERNLLVDEVLGIFKHLYQRSWGDTLSHQLRMALNAVLEIDGSLQDVYVLFTDAEARRRIVRQLKSTELKTYWEDTFPGSSLTTRMSVINKLAPIVHHAFLGPILCARSCGFDADDLITNRKILIVNLATGTRADYTTTILGTFIVNKITAAAYRQGRIAEPERRVRHLLCIDEFQSFMHRASAWDRALSELRKYKLCLVLVTQFVEQVKEDIRAAIFGNVGFLVAFRVGHRDSRILSDEFEGCAKQDLLDLQRGECLVRVGTHAMSVRTRLPSQPQHDPTPQVIERMRLMIHSLQDNDPNTQRDERTALSPKPRLPLKGACDDNSEKVVLCDFA